MISTTFGRVQTPPNLRPPQPPMVKPTGPQPYFSGRTVDNIAIRSKIDSDVYKLLQKAPKTELHVHQGGSASLAFLSYRLRQAIEEGKIDKLLLYKEDGSYIDVLFKDAHGALLPPSDLRMAQEWVLTQSNLRQYYRYQQVMDSQHDYMDPAYIAETTATHQSSDELITTAKLAQQREQGLQVYRQASSKINPFIKNNPSAYKLANLYAKDAAREHVRYTEYRVSPSGNGIGGNTGSNIESVLSSVYDGFRDAQQELNQRNVPLDFGLLVLFERQSRPDDTNPNAKIDRAVALAKQVVELKKQGKYNIVGVDLAGDEANNPVTDFEPAFQIIKNYNATAQPEDRLGITIHAGETTKSGKLKGYESIASAIKIASDDNTRVRIGHGLQIINSSPALEKAFQIYLDHPTDWEKRINENKENEKLKKALFEPGSLLETVIKNKIVLEMCPKSNLQTYGIHPGFPSHQFAVRRSDYSAEAYKRHPAVFLSRLGVKVAISSDNRTISNTDATNEYVKLFKYAGLTYRDFKTLVMNGFEGMFVGDPQTKKDIMADVDNEFKRMERHPDRIRAIYKMGGEISPYQRLILWVNTLRAKL